MDSGRCFPKNSLWYSPKHEDRFNNQQKIATIYLRLLQCASFFPAIKRNPNRHTFQTPECDYRCNEQKITFAKICANNSRLGHDSSSKSFHLRHAHYPKQNHSMVNKTNRKMFHYPQRKPTLQMSWFSGPRTKNHLDKHDRKTFDKKPHAESLQ